MTVNHAHAHKGERSIRAFSNEHATNRYVAFVDILDFGRRVLDEFDVGNVLDGLQAPSIAYDTHELRFASQIVLYVGPDQADLPSIATQMCKLRDCLWNWIEKHPKFTRADANTRIWTVSMLPKFKDMPLGDRRS